MTLLGARPARISRAMATQSASSLVIEPVIEVLPSTLDPHEDTSAAALSDEHAWHRRMRRALDVAGLASLPVEGRWALARDVVELPGATERLVEATLAGADDAGDADEQWVDHVVPCGVAIRVDGVVRAWPGCCADWGVLAELSEALDARSADERSIWIGHHAGALSIAGADRDTLTLRTWRDEKGEPEVWLVDRAALARAIEAAWDLVDRFELIARPIVDARSNGKTVRSRDRRA